MLGESCTRLPLRAGTSALASVAAQAYAFVPSLALIIAAVIGLGTAAALGWSAVGIWSIFASAELTLISGTAICVLTLPYVTFKSLRAAWRQRAVDLVINQTGLAIEGGPHHGFAAPWSAVDSEKTRVDRRQGGTSALVLACSPDAALGEAIELAEGRGEDESRELEAFARILQREGSEADRPTVALSPHHRAGRVNVLLALTGVFTTAAWIAGWTALAVQYQRGTLSAWNVVFMIVGIVIVITAPMLLMVAYLAGRAEVRALASCDGESVPVPANESRKQRGLTKKNSPDHVRERWREYRGRLRVYATGSVVLLPAAAWAIGAGLTPHTEKATALDRCRQNVWTGCVQAGVLEERDTVSGAGARALQFYERACRATQDVGCFELAQMLRDGRRDVPHDDARAVRLFARLCDRNGRADACSAEGLMYWSGQGVHADRVAAHAHFVRACEGGNALGCYLEGTIVAAGIVVTRDAGRALELYRRACDLHLNDGCLALAEALDVGDGMPIDAEAARRLRETACDRGSYTACSFVADRLLASSNSDERSRGVLLLRKGCNSGQDARSCWKLGMLYVDRRLERGEYDSAEKYLMAGCSYGLRESCADFAAHTPRGAELMRAACDGGRTQACLVDNPASPGN